MEPYFFNKISICILLDHARFSEKTFKLKTFLFLKEAVISFSLRMWSFSFQTNHTVSIFSGGKTQKTPWTQGNVLDESYLLHYSSFFWDMVIMNNGHEC